MGNAGRDVWGAHREQPFPLLHLPHCPCLDPLLESLFYGFILYLYDGALFHKVTSSGSAAQQPGVPESPALFPAGKLQAAWFFLESHSMLACICLRLERK